MDTEEKFKALKEFIEHTGLQARAYFDSAHTENEQKADGSVVTAVDTAVEAALLAYVQEHFPGDAIVGEEQGAHEGTTGFVWHIDPIDGTDNFLRRIPFFGISVARLGDTPADSFAIVHNPATGQTFSTFLEEEGGVYENERVCQLTPDALGGRYVVSIGPGKKEPWMNSARYALMQEIGTTYGKGASYGCTALELAYVAANRIDGFLCYGLGSYDYAAGLFLVKSAGGSISVFESGTWQLWDEGLKTLCAEPRAAIFVSHPAIHEAVLGIIGNPERWGRVG